MRLRVAHISDLHLLDLAGAVPFRLFNKRATGYANIRFKRGAIHKREPVFLAAERFRELGVNHVVVSGDVSNLALEKEFELVRSFLDTLPLSVSDVTIVPGNHDTYTRGAHQSRRFETFFAPYLESDVNFGGAPFPVLKLRGNVAIVGLSTAVPRLPLVAAGEIGAFQLGLFERAIARPELAGKTLLVVQHHPPHNPKSPLKTYLEGLRDADREIAVLGSTKSAVIVHGHLHRRVRRRLGPHIESIGATSASLLDPRPERGAGFNLYDFDESGSLVGVETQRFESGGFVSAPLPLEA